MLWHDAKLCADAKLCHDAKPHRYAPDEHPRFCSTFSANQNQLSDDDPSLPMPTSDLDKQASNRRDDVSLKKLRLEAVRRCKMLNLHQLAQSINKNKDGSLQIMFSAKTHKDQCPLRVIVSERGSWQKPVALFLQDKLEVLGFNDPFLVRNSDDILDFLKDNSDKGFSACSFDIKDLYYSLPHDRLLTSVEHCIDRFGTVAFQNQIGMREESFIEMLSFYLKSTFVEWNDGVYIQKQGVCIGSCLAPILSNIFLAHQDKVLFERFNEGNDFNEIKVFRFVDDFLVL
ncbi:uncharacterized protein LOC121833932, partial [Ixodes scapularis]|uniref:uncharacterized protein LOC121833932 n=1 Tax=Ixodes scapularis TaxID=6945 RepID=UPI001C3936C5